MQNNGLVATPDKHQFFPSLEMGRGRALADFNFTGLAGVEPTAKLRQGRPKDPGAIKPAEGRFSEAWTLQPCSHVGSEGTGAIETADTGCQYYCVHTCDLVP